MSHTSKKVSNFSPLIFIFSLSGLHSLTGSFALNGTVGSWVLNVRVNSPFWVLSRTFLIWWTWCGRTGPEISRMWTWLIVPSISVCFTNECFTYNVKEISWISQIIIHTISRHLMFCYVIITHDIVKMTVHQSEKSIISNMPEHMYFFNLQDALLYKEYSSVFISSISLTISCTFLFKKYICKNLMSLQDL